MTGRPAVSTAFWAMGAAALIWNALGCVNFALQMSPDGLAQMPDSHRALVGLRPPWVTAAFATGVFGGVAGAALLLLRSAAAVWVLALSALGVIVATAHAVAHLGAGVTFGPGEIVIAIVAPVVVAIVVWWFARRAKVRGQIT